MRTDEHTAAYADLMVEAMDANAEAHHTPPTNDCARGGQSIVQYRRKLKRSQTSKLQNILSQTVVKQTSRITIHIRLATGRSHPVSLTTPDATGSSAPALLTTPHRGSHQSEIAERQSAPPPRSADC